MKKITKLWYVILTIGILNGCKVDEEVLETTEQELSIDIPCTITVNLANESDSRLTLFDTGNGLKSKWEEGDGFTVYKYYKENFDNDTSNDITVKKHHFVLVSGAGTSVGEFYCESTPEDGLGYNVFYPSEEAFNNCYFKDQVQSGDGNMSHLENKITMKHYVMHYTDIRFINEDYTTKVQLEGYAPSNYKTKASNFEKNIILKVNVSNLPEGFQPVELEIGNANGGVLNFYDKNTESGGINALKTSLKLIDFGEDNNFVAYIACAAKDFFFGMDNELRVAVKDNRGDFYYINKKTAQKYPSGTLLTFHCNSDWKRMDNPNYHSSDFSADGKVHELTPVMKGNINVVFMGDGFSDRQIADGTYREIMEMGKEAFFSVEPFKTYADKFNLFYVDAVSEYECCLEDNTQRTKFGTKHGNGTHIDGNNDLAKEYTLKVDGLSENNLDNYLTVVIMNSATDIHAGGTCHLNWPKKSYDYEGQGYAVCYLTYDGTYESLKGTLIHEANGHGFGKLADEYDAERASSIKTLENYQNGRSHGFYSNVDIISDVTQSLWSEFYVEPYISQEGIGAYEGAFTNNTGFYRPTNISIMRSSDKGVMFNAPSRQAIYIRINKLLNPEWQYDHEEFLKHDIQWMPASPIMLSNDADSRNTEWTYEKELYHTPPVIVD